MVAFIGMKGAEMGYRLISMWEYIILIFAGLNLVFIAEDLHINIFGLIITVLSCLGFIFMGIEKYLREQMVCILLLILGLFPVLFFEAFKIFKYADGITYNMFPTEIGILVGGLFAALVVIRKIYTIKRIILTEEIIRANGNGKEIEQNDDNGME